MAQIIHWLHPYYELEYKLAQSIEEIRNEEGPFSDLYDFVMRVNPGLEQVILLIKAGAFRFTGKERRRFFCGRHI